MNLHKQTSLITLVVSILSSSLALGMDSELVTPVATAQLPTPGMYQI